MPRRINPPSEGAILLASQLLNYLEDELTGRIVAEITASVWQEKESFRLLISASATGALVDPVPGIEGVRGWNRRTAFDFEAILRDKKLQVITRHERGGSEIAGSYRPGKKSQLVERRVGKDGTIDYQSKSDDLRVIELIIDSGKLTPGDYETAVVLHGKERLRTKFRVADRKGAILALKGISEHTGAEVRR
jgi:hypothetical protein